MFLTAKSLRTHNDLNEAITVLVNKFGTLKHGLFFMLGETLVVKSMGLGSLLMYSNRTFGNMTYPNLIFFQKKKVAFLNSIA